ncbi:MAG: DNA polymerase III subunit delta [Solirubrobacterales bacterium]|nr:DNA polymerase III subunit delta [Solirubrobacterales bacterium]
MADEIKDAYLIAGTDEAKIDATRRALRARAEREGGQGALEVFEAGAGRRSPDADAFLGALLAISLIASRRYLLADGVEAWGAKDAERVADALASPPPEATVVLVAHGKAPAKLAKAVEQAKGEVLVFDAPKARELPRKLVGDARRLGYTLEPDAARMLVDRLGESSLRLQNELERLALWAEEGGTVRIEDLEAMVADTSEQAIWSLSDAITEGKQADVLRIAEQLADQGEALPRIVYSLAPRLRQARQAAAELEAGRSPKQVAEGLSMHPYAARMLVKRVQGRDPADLDAAIWAMADLEMWSRGGSDYPEDVALTLSLRSAVGAAG